MIVTEALALVIVGSLLSLLIAISGFFVKRWMDKTEKSEERGLILIERTNESINNLNNTMNKMNINMETFQATIKGSVDSINDKIEIHKNVYLGHKNSIDHSIQYHHDKIDNHETRITVLEKKGE